VLRHTEQESKDHVSTHMFTTALKRKINVKTCTLLHLDTKYTQTQGKVCLLMYTR